MGRIPLESPRIVPECDEMFFWYNLAQTTLRPLLRHPRGFKEERAGPSNIGDIEEGAQSTEKTAWRTYIVTI